MICTHTQQPTMPKLNLRNLKDIDWEDIVIKVPFINPPYFDYRCGDNVGMTNWTMKPKTTHTAYESGMTMLRTLNFIQ